MFDHDEMVSNGVFIVEQTCFWRLKHRKWEGKRGIGKDAENKRSSVNVFGFFVDEDLSGIDRVV